MRARAKAFSKKQIITILTSSLAGGFLNGFLGAAGGILLGLVLGRLFANESILSDRRDLYANIQVAMICVSAVTLSLYSSSSSIDFKSLSWLILPAILGGIVGSLILRKISSKAIGIIFSLLTVYSGIKMVMG